MTFTVVVEAESDEVLDARIRAICRVFQHDLECEVIVENDIGLGLCLNALPLFYTPEADGSTQRSIRILRSAAVNFLPIFDSFRGTRTSLSLFQSREGNLVPFSLLDNETSNHTAVLADSGSGKSALVIDLIQAAKRTYPEPIVFVIDKKSSYTMLSRFFDAEFTIFERNQPVPFSPFRGKYDDEKFAFLTKLIVAALNSMAPSLEVESDHLAAITSALRQAYQKKLAISGLGFDGEDLIKSEHTVPVELTMDDVVAELAGLSDNGRDLRIVTEPLLQKLRPFYGDGIYAPFFRGIEMPTDVSNRFYIYDLDALDGDSTLQSLMTMAVTEEIRRILSLPENQGRVGFIVMEEFAMLGRNNKTFADFAIDFAETMRKRGCWLITLTPRPQNYFETEVGRAFWAVADNYLFLQMNTDNVDYLAEKSTLLDEANREIIRSLRTIRGSHAEVFYSNKKKTCQGAFCYRQTSIDRWLSPTNAQDMKLASEALAKFPDKWQALSCLQERGSV